MFRLLVALSVLSLALGLDDRIVNGRSASIHDFPYQVSLQQYKGHFCGGSILKPNWILTAAHCLVDIKDNEVHTLTVRAGSSRWNQGGVVRKVDRFLVHPNYDNESMIFDVGLVQLESPLIYSGVIKPIVLPSKTPPLFEPVVVSGWGQLSENNGNMPEILQEVELKFLTLEKCKSPEYGYRASVSTSMICADGPSKDSCQGDSGGPLVLRHTNVQVGVVSWGVGCAQNKFPGIYCDLTNPEVVSYLKRNVPNL